MRIIITSENTTDSRGLDILVEQLQKVGAIKNINKKTLSGIDLEIHPIKIINSSIIVNKKENIENTKKLILELREQPNLLSFNQIAERLNQFGYKTTTGKKWHKSQVKRIVDENRKNKHEKSHRTILKLFILILSCIVILAHDFNWWILAASLYIIYNEKSKQ